MSEAILQLMPLVLVNVIICVAFFSVARRKSRNPWIWLAGMFFIPVFNWVIIVPLLASKTDLDVLERLNALEGKPD